MDSEYVSLLCNRGIASTVVGVVGTLDFFSLSNGMKSGVELGALLLRTGSDFFLKVILF